MLNSKIKTISVLATAALLSGCTSSGGGFAPARPLASCAADTTCGIDAVTVSVPVNVQTGVGRVTTATGPATLLGATTLTATLDPATNKPVSATISGGVNTSVATLTLQGAGDPNPGSFAGTAANGQNVLLTSFSKLNPWVGPAGVPPTTLSPSNGLTYSDFGDWIMTPAATGPGTATYSVWAEGTQFTSTMPTSGSATYTGVTTGISLVNATNTPYRLNGNLTLTANFTAAGGTVAGSITGITAATYPGNGIPGTAGTKTLAGGFNDIILTNGTIAGNAFSAMATAGTVPLTIPGPHPAAVAVGTTGQASGHFYGPAANEVTGVWSLSTTSVQALGSFGAKQ